MFDLYPAPRRDSFMQRFRAVVPFLAVAVLATACADAPETTLAPDAVVLESLAGSESGLLSFDVLESTGNFLVVLNGQRVPRNFHRVIEAHGGAVETSYDGIGVIVATGLTPRSIAELEALDEVRSVSPDYLIPLELPTEIAMDQADVQGEVLNDDPGQAQFFPRQWHLRAISADVAWAAGKTGSPDVTVAILDTGIDYTHPDLVGLVDLSRSASFVPFDQQFIDFYFPGAHPVADLHYHGTHVAATVSSNASAAAGVTSKTTLIGVKVCNVNGSCPTSAVLAGIMYAADQGAHIINMSLGGLFLKSDYPGFVSVIQRAINDAHRRGTVIITSAGNATADLDRDIVPLPAPPTTVPLADRIPTHLPSLFALYCDGATAICVSATGPTARAGINGPWTNIDSPSTYSNFGRSAIDVAAPGGNGASSVTAACSRFSLQVPICQTGIYVLGINGTSMASPHAAGVAALLVANGARGPAQIRSGLHQTADDLGEVGTDPHYGKGRVNAATAAGVK
jgi:lantibiotic leader peptide-processing serine protease